MKIETPRQKLTLQSSNPSEDGRLEVYYDNRGEPYRQGISLSLERPDLQVSANIFLETWEGRAFRDLLLKLYPLQMPPVAPDGLLTTVADKIAAGEVVDATESAEETAQYIRDLVSASSLQDAYTGSQEEVAIWKKRALEAETELRELPTIEMVLLQAQRYANATSEENQQSELGDLRNLITHLPSDSK
uniref:Tail assembly chaperone n=1 Tax=Pseudomonas phage Nican01 TaxID=3138540 RepID=A0AAU6W0V4_9CAUD